MHTGLKQAMLTGASIAFLAFSGAALTSAPAQAGPLALAPKHKIALPSLVETVQYRRARASRVRAGRRVVRHRARGRIVRHRAGARVVRYRGARHARYYRGPRYVHRAAYGAAYGAVAAPAAIIGLFAGALGAAALAPAYAVSCAPYHYSWNYCGGYYPAYYGGYYPAWRSGPAVRYRYRSRPVVYRSGYYRPRTVRYRAVAPRRHYIGARTYVRSGYRVRRARR